MYGPTHFKVYLNGRPMARRMVVARGIRQGCLSSGIVWAFLCDPMGIWLLGALPWGDLWLTVFADDIALD